MVAIADACLAGKIRAEIAIVLSDMPEAGILAHARERGLTADFIAPGAFRTKLDEEAERLFIGRLVTAQVDFVALAGFMRILDTGLVEAWQNRLINIHPSLLPAFPGLHPQRQALSAGVRFSGCTVHFVRAEMDTGPIIAQAIVPVHDDDDEKGLAARILAAEHRLYPLAVRLYAEGRLRIDGNRAVIAGGTAPDIVALNPVA